MIITAIQVLGTYLRANVKSEKGATAVEYGLLVALIAAFIIGAVVLLGENILGGFETVNEKLAGEDAGAGGAGGGE